MTFLPLSFALLLVSQSSSLSFVPFHQVESFELEAPLHIVPFRVDSIKNSKYYATALLHSYDRISSEEIRIFLLMNFHALPRSKEVVESLRLTNHHLGLVERKIDTQGINSIDDFALVSMTVAANDTLRAELDRAVSWIRYASESEIKMGQLALIGYPDARPSKTPYVVPILWNSGFQTNHSEVEWTPLTDNRKLGSLIRTNYFVDLFQETLCPAMMSYCFRFRARTDGFSGSMLVRRGSTSDKYDFVFLGMHSHFIPITPWSYAIPAGALELGVRNFMHQPKVDSRELVSLQNEKVYGETLKMIRDGDIEIEGRRLQKRSIRPGGSISLEGGGEGSGGGGEGSGGGGDQTFSSLHEMIKRAASDQTELILDLFEDDPAKAMKLLKVWMSVLPGFRGADLILEFQPGIRLLEGSQSSVFYSYCKTLTPDLPHFVHAYISEGLSSSFDRCLKEEAPAVKLPKWLRSIKAAGRHSFAEFLWNPSRKELRLQHQGIELVNAASIYDTNDFPGLAFPSESKTRVFLLSDPFEKTSPGFFDSHWTSVTVSTSGFNYDWTHEARGRVYLQKDPLSNSFELFGLFVSNLSSMNPKEPKERRIVFETFYTPMMDARTSFLFPAKD